ncbi:MAG: proprotein convertase P-domain-containing protein [Acidobacteriota bacterium]|nr:proprotein convertase P-domain-containing protein [Acidobacteriota bacterium]
MRLPVVFLVLFLSAAAVNAQDLRLDYERESLIGTYRHYTQYVDGLAVLGGEIIERVDHDGSVRELHRAIATAAPKRALIAKRSALWTVPAGTVRDEQLVAVSISGEARPAWRVVVEENPHEPTAHYIDAATGALLLSKPLFARITGKGRVFDPNPVTKLNDPSLRDQNDSPAAVPETAYSLVNLLELNPTGMLAGPNVQIVDTDAPATPHADASQPLLFDRGQPQFEEVNVYFHVDRSQRYLQSLGYTGARRIAGYAIPIDPHSLSGSDNSLYVGSVTPGQGKVYFGDGGVDDAEDSDIVLHEFCHAIQDWIAPSVFFGTSSSQSRAMGEGYSDYWAYSSNYEPGLGTGRDPYCLAEWDARCGGDDPSQNCGYPDNADCLRRVDSAKTMNDYINGETSGTEHKNGEIWSSALREIFDALVRRHGVTDGRRMADTLVIESMFGAPVNPTYAVMARKLIDADRILNSGVHAGAICSAFIARLILGSTDCDRAPRGDVTFVQSPQHGFSIPDNASGGITSTLDVTDSRSIDRLVVSVNIVHPSRGDLQILLVAPDGITAILQNPSTDRSPSAAVTYGIDADPADRLDVFRGRAANGRWTLIVRDLQPQSSGTVSGTLISWSLGITFVGDVTATTRPSSFAPRKHIAAVAHAQGALGTTWQTDVRLFNSGSREANVTAILTRAGEEGWGHFAAVRLAVAPKQVVALDDVVATTMQTSGVGQLEFLGDTDALIVTSRTYTRAGGGTLVGTLAGTYGQFIPAVATTDATTLANVPHILSTADFRTNLGFAEVNGSEGTVRVTLFDAATGAVISQRDFPIVPFGQMQFPATGAELMTAELRVISGDARIVAYGSVIDNRSGDPIYVASTPPHAGSFVAPVISQPGVNTLWRSDLVVSAFGDGGGDFDLTYVDSVTGGRSTKHGTVSAHQAIRIDDVVGSYFGRANAFGAIRADLSGNLVATSRTFTTSSTGTYGQFIPLIRSDEGFVQLAPGGAARELLHIERSSAFRTNLGAINTGSSDAVVRFALFDAAGQALGSTDRTVRPLQVVQFPVDALTSSAVADGRIEVQMISGTTGAIAWASVIDNATGDPIFVPAQ